MGNLIHSYYLFDQSIMLYTAIFFGLVLCLGQIMGKWYYTKLVCRDYTCNSSAEVYWTIVPILFLMIIVIYSVTVIYNNEIHNGTNINITHFIGNQWYWIINSGSSTMHSASGAIVHQESRVSRLNRIILADQPCILFANTNVQFLISSLDVIHSFSLPSLGIKVDAIPGRIHNIMIYSLIQGLYIGYCSELCGSGHAFMPINVIFY